MTYKLPGLSIEDGCLHFWELVEATPLSGGQGGQQGHAAAVLCVAFYEETLVTCMAVRGLFFIVFLFLLMKKWPAGHDIYFLACLAACRAHTLKSCYQDCHPEGSFLQFSSEKDLRVVRKAHEVVDTMRAPLFYRKHILCSQPEFTNFAFLKCMLPVFPR